VRVSAGVLMFRRTAAGFEVLLAHPGGPHFRDRDEGGWTLPKGLLAPGEDALATARREFEEETGASPGDGPFAPLGDVVQRGGKRVFAWAVEGDLDPASARSNTFELEWPPRSGRWQVFPEVDRVGWFAPEAARSKLNPAQVAFLDRLARLLAAG
jgi:predicted NUDIX family NTP pyrophosphohydrolase